MIVSSNFDGGNIEVAGQGEGHLDLRIAKDNAADFFQWFYFRLSEAKGQSLAVRILNAGEASYVKGWEGYGVCVSQDRQSWTRLPTSYADGVLGFTLRPAAGDLWVAYYPPYPFERHLDLVARTAARPGVALRRLGTTLDGRDMDALVVGKGALSAWVIARQHPGETMAEWWMEGFLARLTDADDPLAAEARQLMRLHIVPNMNPDGGVRGNLRTNAAGANLNREWGVATSERSPEVHYVMEAMRAAPPAFCLDVHGDEALPYNFIAGAEGIPGYTASQAEQLADFLAAYKRATPEFQTRYGYPKTAAGKANLTLCTNWCAHTFGGLAMTLEMPFKDNADRPDAERGWSTERTAKLGHDTLEPIVAWARKAQNR